MDQDGTWQIWSLELIHGLQRTVTFWIKTNSHNDELHSSKNVYSSLSSSKDLINNVLRMWSKFHLLHLQFGSLIDGAVQCQKNVDVLNMEKW